MKKFASRILVLSLIFASMILGISACGNPYKNMKMTISSPSIVYNSKQNRNEFELTSSSSVFNIDVKIDGVDNSVDKRVNISLEHPTEVLELVSVDDSNAQKTGITTARILAKNGGYATIKCVSREGGLVQTYKVFVVIPLQSIEFKSAVVPIVKGKTTDIANSLVNEGSLYDYVKFTPSNTNQKDSIEFVVAEGSGTAPVGVYIDGTKITISDSCTASSFNLKAKYKIKRANENGEIVEELKETSSITFKVLTPFDVTKVEAFNENGGENNQKLERDVQDSYLYHLKLSTNLNNLYSDSYQALLAFKYMISNGLYGNILDPSENTMFNYGTEYSITCETELESNTITSFSQVLDVKRTSGYQFNIVHKNYAITTDVKFYVNYKGYEDYFKDTLITVRVEVLAFPEDIMVANSEEDANKGESISQVSVYKEYASSLRGTPIYVAVLGPDDQELNLEKFKAEIQDDDDILELLVKRGASYEVINADTVLSSGTELFLRLKSGVNVTKTTAKIIFTSVLNSQVSKEIGVNILTEAVKWNNGEGNASAEIYLNYTEQVSYEFKFLKNDGSVEPTWLDSSGIKKNVYSALKASDFKVDCKDDDIVKIGDVSEGINSIVISNAQNKMGSTIVTITTPNGFVLTIKVSVVINLSEDYLKLELIGYKGKADDSCIKVKETIMKSYTALVGDKQEFGIYYTNNSISYKLGYNNGYSYYEHKSSNPVSVRVEDNYIVARNASTVENQAKISITIKGYNWSGSGGSVSESAPELKDFVFEFTVLVLNPVKSVSLDKTTSAIYTKDTLNIYKDETVPDALSEYDTKGIATINLSINPTNTTTTKTIYWKLFRDLNGIELTTAIIDINKKSDTIRVSDYGLDITYEVSDDLTRLTLWASLIDASNSSKKQSLSANIYAFVYVDEVYTNLNGENFNRTYSKYGRISVSNAILTENIIPEVAFNTISFDKRELTEDTSKSTSSRIYFDQTDPDACIEFSYKLNPINPENKTIIASVDDASIRAEVDSVSQKVKVYVVSLNTEYTPIFTLYLKSADSQNHVDSSYFSCFVAITVKVQDGLLVPYEIATEEELRNLANNSDNWGDSYHLTNNIELTNAWEIPIGNTTNPFTGSFSGIQVIGGTSIQYTISGLNATGYKGDYYGLFGVVKDAELTNIKLSNVQVNLNISDKNVGVGALVGCAINSKITECYIDDGNGLAKTDANSINSAKISNKGITFTTNTTITETKMVALGGIVGTMIGGKIENSTSLVSIKYKASSNNDADLLVYVGGMVGYLTSSDKNYKWTNDAGETKSAIDIETSGATISNLPNIIFSEDYSNQGYNVVSVITYDSDLTYLSSNNSAFGGVVGLNNGYIKGGKFRTIITGKNNIGGIAGINLQKIEDSVVSPTLLGSENIGGAVGTNSSGLLNHESIGMSEVGAYEFASNQYNIKFATESSGFGILKGVKVQFLDHDKNYSYLKTAIAGKNNLGGLIGLNIAKCENNEFVSKLSYNSVYSYVSVNGVNLLGEPFKQEYDVTNTNGYYYGDIVLISKKDNQSVGGLVGSANNLAITNSYSFVVINQAGVNKNAIIGGALGSILEKAGNILLSNLNIKGEVVYLSEDKTSYLNSGVVGGFIGDATNLKNDLTLKSGTDSYSFDYSRLNNFSFEDSTEEYSFYNIQSSYTLLKFYAPKVEDKTYVANFAGNNETKDVTTSYTDRYSVLLSYDGNSYSNIVEKAKKFIKEATINGGTEDVVVDNIKTLNIVIDNEYTGSLDKNSIKSKIEGLKYVATITTFDAVTGTQTVKYYYYTSWDNIPTNISNKTTEGETSATYSSIEFVSSGSILSFEQPVVLASNSYYIGFKAYLRNASGNISETPIEISEDIAKEKEKVDFYYYTKDTSGNYVAYFDGTTVKFVDYSTIKQCDYSGDEKETGFYKLPNGLIITATQLNERRYSKSTSSVTDVYIYSSGYCFDNINLSLLTAGQYAEADWDILKVKDIDNFTGWDKTDGKPSDLSNYNSYLNSGVNDGYPILFSENKEDNGKVEFIVDLPPKEIKVEYNYSNENAYQTEHVEITVQEESDGIITNVIDTIEKVTDYITLSYYKVDTKLLPELFGYYDLNNDGNLEVSQNEKIYTNHIKAIIREKNRYKLSDILTFVAEPAYLDVSDLTVSSSSSLIEVEYINGEIYIVLLGSGKATLEIFSNLNTSIYNKIQINIMNKVSGIELFKDSTYLDDVSIDDEFVIVKGFDTRLYVKTEEYLTKDEGLNQGFISNYGNIALAKNNYFKVGVRYYVLTKDADGNLTPYHNDVNCVPAVFTINGLPFNRVKIEDNKYLVYVNCDSITNVNFYGLLKNDSITLMAVPYLYENSDGDKTLLYKDELTATSGKVFKIKIIDGTFGINSTIDSNTDPFKAINFETIITTDNANTKSYISIAKVEKDKNVYEDIKGLNKATSIEGVTEFTTFKDENGNTVNIDNVNIYELPKDLQTFTFNKFKVKITGINYYDNNDTIIDITKPDWETELKYIKYSFQISVQEDYLYHIGEIENFLFKFYTVKTSESAKEQVIETSFNYNITPQEVESVAMYHYADIQVQTIDLSTGQQTIITEVNQDYISNTLVCGEPGLLHINVHPGYSDVEYVEISSNFVNGYSVQLEQMYANYILSTDNALSDKFIFAGTYTALPVMEDVVINNGLGIRLSPNSFGYIENGLTKFDYNGNFYIKTAIPTIYDASIVFTLTVKGFANGKVVFTDELTILPQLKPELEFHSKGKTDIPVAIGTEIEITLRTDGTIDESSKFDFSLNTTDVLTQSELDAKEKEFINYLGLKEGTTDTYILKLNYNEALIGKIFYLEVTSFKDVNNNRYETVKKIAIQPVLYVVDNIYVENVEYLDETTGVLKGNYNQDYALKVYVNATYCKDKDVLNTALHAAAGEDLANPKIQEIKKEIEKLEARLTSLGLYGEYQSLTDYKRDADGKLELDASGNKQYVYEDEQVVEWQAEANKFGETEIKLKNMKNLDIWQHKIQSYIDKGVLEDTYIPYSSKSWFVVEEANGQEINESISVQGKYKGVAISNGRAENLSTDRFISQSATDPNVGYILQEPYATLNVRVTDINTTTKLKFQVSIDYGSLFGYTGVGVVGYSPLNSTSAFATAFETTFGFNALQLANEENPEPIYTTEEFKAMSSGGHYILMEDIELDYWTPLNTPIASFDGNGYVIRVNSFNEVDEKADKNIGIFSVVNENTILKNMIVEVVPSNRDFDETKELTSTTEGDLVVRTTNLTGIKFGLIAGVNNGTITNTVVVNNADSYREERDIILHNSGKLTETELRERRLKYYSEYLKDNSLVEKSARTSSIISVIQSGETTNKENTDSKDIRIATFVGLNLGFITNSSVENISLISSYYVAGFVCENDSNAKISSSYFKGGNVINTDVGNSTTYTNNGTAGFTVINRGEINYSYVLGREIGESKNISGIDDQTRLPDEEIDKNSKSNLYVDRYVGLRYTYSPYTTGRSDKLNSYLTGINYNYKTLLNMRAIGSVVKSTATATGFVYNNTGTITNSYSNIFIIADVSSGFVYVNDESAKIENSFTLSSVQSSDTDHTPFSGVTYESGTKNNLGKGTMNNCYYLNVTAEDYQELYEIYDGLIIDPSHAGYTTEQEELHKSLETNGPFLGKIYDKGGLSMIVNSEARWTDEFKEDENEQALPLSAVEFSSYTSFATFSFNSDYALNGMEDILVSNSGEQHLARSVWFIPEASDNEAIENPAIKKYFRHSNYIVRVPQLVSANLKTMSLRYANFIKQLPADSSMEHVLATLKEKMGYARIESINEGINAGGFKNNWEIIQSILLSDVTLPYSVGYANELGQAIIDAYLKVKDVPYEAWPKITGTNTVENQIYTYFSGGIGSLQFVSDDGVNDYKHLKNKDILDILIVAVNSLNAVTEDSKASYSYSYVQTNQQGANINYGSSVLNPYLVTSADKFNIYTLQINSLGEITAREQGASLRLVKDIAFDNIIQTAQTYKSTFYGDFEGNGLTVNDLRIVAEETPELKLAGETQIENLGLFGVITNKNDQTANIRNLNIDVQALSATAVKYVGGLAGQIKGGVISNIKIMGDNNSIIEGFNATGGLAGRISGDFTLVSNVYNSVSIKSNYYTTAHNSNSSAYLDNNHRFNLYTGAELDIDGNEISNINKVSYAGGIAGILEAKIIESVGSAVGKINTNIRSNGVTGDIQIRGEVVGGLFGYIGEKSKISNSKLTATTNLKLYASAIAGGIVGDLRGKIETSDVVNQDQAAIDKIIYNTVYSNANASKSTISLDFEFENEATNLFDGNAHYIGGLVGLSYNGIIDKSFNRVDVANINSKYAGGIIGLSVGARLSDVYTTASVNSFVAYGGIIGLQTIEELDASRFGNGELYGHSSMNDYHFLNWDKISNKPSSTTISMSSIVGANLWKEAHKNTNRDTYIVDAYRAQIGSFIGRAMSYNEKSAYDMNDINWYNQDSNKLQRRIKNESVFFMMDYTASAKKTIINEIGNATSVKVNFDKDQRALVENVKTDDYIVRNSTAYIMFEKSSTIPTVYAYSGDFSSKISVDGGSDDEDYQYYRFSRLQNYGSLRTIKEIIQGIYLQSETIIDGLTARIYDSNFARYDLLGDEIVDALNYNYIETNTSNSKQKGEYALNKILIDVTGIKDAGGNVIKDVNGNIIIDKDLASSNDNYTNSEPQTIYNNWSSDAWLGTVMVKNSSSSIRQNANLYVFPQHRTKVYESVIYVRVAGDLINNAEKYPDATYIILNDIDLDPYKDSFTPLNTQENPFTGTLKSYINAKLFNFQSDSDSKVFGLFAYTDGATFLNFTVDVKKLKVSGSESFGILVGEAKNTEFDSITITDESAVAGTDEIETSAKNVGGLVGRVITEAGSTRILTTKVDLRNVVLNATNNSVNAGLICGKGNNAQILGSVASGNIKLGNLSNANVGGIIGLAEDSLILNSDYACAYANFSGSSDSNIGGLVGKAEHLWLMYSGSDGVIQATSGSTNWSNIGGLVGLIQYTDSNIMESYIDVSISNTELLKLKGEYNNIGGFIGKINSNNSDSIKNSYSTGSIDINSNNNYVGGMIGYIQEPSVATGGITITSSYSMNKINRDAVGTTGTVGAVIGKAENIGTETFPDALYVYDFMPVNNDYGTSKTSYQFRTLTPKELGLSDVKLEDIGLTGTDYLWIQGGYKTTIYKHEGSVQVLSYPLLNLDIFKSNFPLQKSGNNQTARKITSFADINNNKAIYCENDIPGNLSLKNSTVYLNSNKSHSGDNWEVDQTSALFGLNDNKVTNITNKGVISESKLTKEDAGLLVQSYIYRPIEIPSTIPSKSWYNSYVLYAGTSGKNKDMVYYDIKAEPYEANQSTEIKDFIDEGFDFDNYWTVYHIKDSSSKILVEYTPVLKWQISKDSDYWTLPSGTDLKSYFSTYSDSNPFKITSIDEYIKLLFAFNEGEGLVPSNVALELDTDLEFEGKILLPLGTKQKPFKGTFNGNGHTISGILINGEDQSTVDSMGLFGYVSGSATIQGLKISGSSEKAGVIIGNSSQIAGGLVGTNWGTLTIKDVQINTSDIDYRMEILGGTVGGFVGSNQGSLTIQDSVFQGMLYGYSVAGGFIGENTETENTTTDQKLNIYTSYISNGDVESSLATSQNIFGKGNIGLLVGKIEGNNSESYNFKEVYVSTCEGKDFNYFGRVDNKPVKIDSTFVLAGFGKFETDQIGSTSLLDVTNVSNLKAFQSDNFDGFSWGKVWTRLSGSNNGCPIFFDAWNEGAMIPDSHKDSSGNKITTVVNEGLIVTGDSKTSEETDYINSLTGVSIIEINTPAELAWIARAVNLGITDFSGLTIKMTTTIDLQGKSWEAIGCNDHSFKGIFDGGSYVIKNINGAGYKDSEYSGLFGYINGATIQNLQVSGTIVGKTYVGGVVGYAVDSTLSTVTITSDKINIRLISGSSDTVYVGGIVGKAERTSFEKLTNYSANSIEVNQADITQTLNTIYIGGIAGYVGEASKVVNSLYNQQGIIVNAPNAICYAGGVAGVIKGVTSATNINTLKHYNGKIEVVSKIENYGADLAYSTRSHVGGLVGVIDVTAGDITINRLITSTTSITGCGTTGGLVGLIKSNGDISIDGDLDVPNNNASISASTSDYVGGLFGYISAQSLKLTNFENAGSVDGNSYVAGLIGYAEIKNNFEISSSSNSGNVTRTEDYVAGIVGCVKQTDTGLFKLDNITNSGAITGSQNYVAGIIGNLDYNNITNFEIVDVYNSGNVTGIDYVAGIIGKTTLKSSNKFNFVIGTDSKAVENTGTITGNSYTAGIIGELIIEGSGTEKQQINLTKITNSGDIKNTSSEKEEYIAGIIGNLNIKLGTNSENTINFSKISNSAIVNATTNSTYVGGIFGSFEISEDTVAVVELKDIKNLREITGGEYVGGIAGLFENKTSIRTNANYTVNSGAINGETYVGGLFGKTINIKLYIDPNYSDLSSDQKDEIIYISDAAGNKKEDYTIHYFRVCVNSGSITATGNYVGGFIGQAVQTSIEGLQQAEASGNLKVYLLVNSGSITATGTYVGGIVGSFNELQKSSDTSVSYYTYAESGTDEYIENNKLHYLENKGEVGGDANIGGIAGYSIAYSKVLNNIGNVTGTAQVGGIFGTMFGKSNILKNSGTISATSTMGGIIGGIIGKLEIAKDKDSKILDSFTVVQNFQSVGNSDLSLIGTLHKEGTTTNITNQFKETAIWLGLDGCKEADSGYNKIVGNIRENNYQNMPLTNFGTINGKTLANYYVNSPQWTIFAGGKTNTVSVILAEINALAKIPDGITATGAGTTVSGDQLTQAEKDFINSVGATIEIDDAMELAWIARAVNLKLTSFEGKTIKLTKDIDLNGKRWNVIGYDAAHPFKGTFDGDGNTISGIVASGISKDVTFEYMGLFGYIEGATIQNLNIAASGVAGTKYVGALVGYSKDSTISNVNISSIVNLSNEETEAYIGGVVGKAENTIFTEVETTNSDTIKIVSNNISNLYFGGVVGHANGGSQFNDLTNTLNLEVNASITTCYVGGIAGYLNAVGNYSATNLNNSGSINVTCYTGSITGGIAGVFNPIYSTDPSDINDITIQNIKNTGTEIIVSSGIVGGIFGEVLDDGTNMNVLTISEGENNSSISASNSDYVGGIIGKITSDICLYNLVNKGSIQGVKYTGGIVGYYESNNHQNNLSIKLIKNEGKINYVNNSQYIGGLIGCLKITSDTSYVTSSVTIEENLLNSGNILPVNDAGDNANAKYIAGGFGYLEISIYGQEIYVKNITNSGSVKGVKYSGGIAGYIKIESFSNSDTAGGIINLEELTNNGVVVGGDYTGGIAGEILLNNINSGSALCTTTINNLQNNANVNGGMYVGGIAGYIKSNVSVSAVVTNTGTITATSSYVGDIFGGYENVTPSIR